MLLHERGKQYTLSELRQILGEAGLWTFMPFLLWLLPINQRASRERWCRSFLSDVGWVKEV